MSKHKNTIDKLEFFIYQYFWCSLMFMLYSRILFKPIGDWSLKKSYITLVIIILFIIPFFVVLECKKRRNHYSIFLNIFSAFGLYIILSYIDTRKKLIFFILNISICLSLLSIDRIMNQKVICKKHIKKVIFKRIQNSLIATNMIFGIGMAFIIVIVSIDTFLVKNTSKTDIEIKDINNFPAEERDLDNNYDTIELLRPNRWEKLSTDEKITVLQTICTIEQEYLGLPNKLSLTAINIDNGVLGNYYDNPYPHININLKHLESDDSKSVLNTVLHEIYHSFQYRLCDAYDKINDEKLKTLRAFRKVYLYKSNFANYIAASKDGYYEQIVETEARAYAANAAEYYFKRILDDTTE